MSYIWAWWGSAGSKYNYWIGCDGEGPYKQFKGPTLPI